MEKILNDKTVVVLPLATESTVEAIVALCMTPAHMMEHFDHYRYLAKYSAMSLAKQTSSLRVQQAQMMTIVSLAKLMEFRDAETGEHLERLMKYTEILARELSNDNAFTLEINDAYISDLVNSCLLHDIGKVGIPDHILKKPSKLTFEEYEMMKQHAIFGAHSLVEAEKRSKGRTFLSMSKEIALYHHEWWNGTGYPHRLKEEQIPLSARIVAVVDVYDALRSHRSYKDSMTHEESCFIIRNESGTHFDPRIVDAFLRRERDIYEHSIEPGEHLL
jgi:HD-GYP domain-containing protein (c-di-GMP phosphodiesterase class II)